jgi:parallel beta-helix repeat protein
MEVRNATGSCVVIDKFVGPLNNIWWTGGKVHDCSPSGPDYAFYFNGDDQLVENVEIYNVPNYCFHNFKEGGTPLRMIFRNNVVHHCSASRPDQAAVLLMGTNPRAYNNLLYSNSGNGIMTYTVNTSGWLIDNNTVYGSGQRGIYIRTGSGTGSVRNNIVFNNSLGNIVNEQGGSTTLTTNWTSDPLFVNVSALNFHIQPTSPARDAGTQLSGFTTDFDGQTRTGIWDIGFDEIAGVTRYVATSLPSGCSNGSTNYDPTANGGTGGCGGSGSSTIYNVCNTAYLATQAGDALLFRGGTYNCIIRVEFTGTQASPIVFSGYLNESVTLRPEFAHTWLVRWTPATVGYVSFKNMHIDGSTKLGPAFGGDTGPGSEPGIPLGDAGHHHLTFENFRISHSWSNCIQGAGDSFTLINVEVDHCGVNNDTYDANGFYFTHLTNSTITGLYGHDNECYAIRIGDSSPNDRAATNTIQKSRFTANGNLAGVRDCSTSGGGAIVLYGRDQTVKNSLIYDNTGQGILLGRENSQSFGNFIYNNTVTRNQVGIQVGANGLPTTDHFVSNNLVTQNTTNLVIETFAGSSAVCQTNLLGTAVFNSTCPVGNGGGSILTYTLSSSDFHLKLGTNIAVDAATNLAAVTDDFEGNTRTLPKDIGAYERQSSDTTPPIPPSNLRLR